MSVYDLERFKAAQQPVYHQVLRELTEGHKRTHWMWFIFPQAHGLGSSEMARRYAITSLDEARAYLADNVLGPRLGECTGILLSLPETSATRILGTPDDLKFKSSMTLFAMVSSAPLFENTLDKFFGGVRDERTLAILKAA